MESNIITINLYVLLYIILGFVFTIIGFLIILNLSKPLKVRQEILEILELLNNQKPYIKMNHNYPKIEYTAKLSFDDNNKLIINYDRFDSMYFKLTICNIPINSPMYYIVDEYEDKNHIGTLSLNRTERNLIKNKIISLYDIQERYKQQLIEQDNKNKIENLFSNIKR